MRKRVKMKIKQILLASILSMVLTSCTVQRVYPVNGEQLAVNEKLGQNKALIVSYGGVEVTEFKSTFADDFGSEFEFINEIESKVEAQFQKRGLMAVIDENTADLIDQYESESYKVVINKLEKSKVASTFKYAILIDELKVGSEFSEHTSHDANTGMSQTTTSEAARVEARFNVVDLKTKSTIVSFVSVGTKSVFMFAFSTALEGAMDSMVKRAIDYLLKGKTKF